MEITLLPQTALRIKGKHAVLVIDPQDKSAYNAAIFLNKNQSTTSVGEDIVILNGPGEYEVGGIKIKGLKGENDTLYSINIDGIDLLLGKISSLDKMQHKLQEHKIVVVSCDANIPASFLTSLSSNVILYYGDKSTEITQTIGQENLKTLPKYTTTLDKLPQEMETVLLQ